MAKWGDYTLTITYKGEVVKELNYTGMSGTAMMDEAKFWRRQYPENEGYLINW